MPFPESPEGQTRYCEACEREARLEPVIGVWHTCGKSTLPNQADWIEEWMKLQHHPDCFYEANRVCDCAMGSVKLDFIIAKITNERQRVYDEVEGVIKYHEQDANKEWKASVEANRDDDQQRYWNGRGATCRAIIKDIKKLRKK